MKKSLFALAIVFMSLAANATSIHPDTFAKQSNLTRFNIDKDYVYADAVTGGTLKVNVATRLVELELRASVRCPSGARCLARPMPPRPLFTRLPIVSIKRDPGCGIVTYIAREDRRSTDSEIETIKITDYSQTHCEMYYTEPTAVVHQVRTYLPADGVKTTTSTMYGNELLPLYSSPRQ